MTKYSNFKTNATSLHYNI